MFTIEFVGFFNAQGVEIVDPSLIHGYQADDYLPDYDGQEFENENLAKRWVESNHKGLDVDGIEARFVILSS